MESITRISLKLSTNPLNGSVGVTLSKSFKFKISLLGYCIYVQSFAWICEIGFYSRRAPMVFQGRYTLYIDS